MDLGTTAVHDQAEIEYPSTDGEPMAESTVQYRWIVVIKEGIDLAYRDDPNVFVAADLFWYPVRGEPGVRKAPDVMVVVGRPKGERPSYLQWREDGVAPQVVFEVISPGNRDEEMREKFAFYQRHGVEEYYVFDPEERTLEGWRRRGKRLRPIAKMDGWVSPRLRVRFEWRDGELVLYAPNGRRFETVAEISDRAEAERQRAEVADQRAVEERQRAEVALQRAEEERQRAEVALQRAERLAERLRALGVDPDAV